MTQTFWTEEKCKALVRLWAEGASASHIGRQLGCGKNAVLSKRQRLDLPRRPSLILRNGRSRPTLRMHEERGIPCNKDPVKCCCWPEGEPGKPDFHFCGGDAVPNKPYCADHCERAYVIPENMGY